MEPFIQSRKKTKKQKNRGSPDLFAGVQEEKKKTKNQNIPSVILHVRLWLFDKLKEK